MTMDTRRFTRQELYGLAWSQPMIKTAASLGLSDIGLTKICRKNGIPVPGRGYWRKLETGGKVRKTPLGRRKDETTITIEVRSMPEETIESEAVESQKKFELAPENRIRVCETLDRPHLITAATRKALQHQKPDEYGRIKFESPQAFPFRVATASADRALRILDTLLKALQGRGYTSIAGASERERARVMVNGEAIRFSIEEPSQRKAHRLSEEEKSRQAKGTLYYVQAYDYVPTGKLTLKLDTPYSSGLPASFSDTARQSVDERLNDVIVAMVRIAEWEKAARRRQEEKQRRLDEENEKRASVIRRQQEEAASLKRLHQDADAWNTAERIRRYIAAVEARARETGADISLGGAHHEWACWANAQADRIDPLRESPPSILDEKPPRLLSMWEFT